jgi:hypothetical protein
MMNYHCDLPDEIVIDVNSISVIRKCQKYVEIESVSSGGGEKSMQREIKSRNQMLSPKIALSSFRFLGDRNMSKNLFLNFLGALEGLFFKYKLGKIIIFGLGFQNLKSQVSVVKRVYETTR